MTKNLVVSVERVVTASPEVIFDFLADPRNHSLIDGSGTVRDTQTGVPARLSIGAKFGMQMKLGVPYKITNEVVEFVEGKQISWRHMGGHVWRYILEPVAGGTKVTEQFDYTNAKSVLMLRLAMFPSRNKKSMVKTLGNLAARFAPK